MTCSAAACVSLTLSAPFHAHRPFAVPESEELDCACSTMVRQLGAVKPPLLHPTWNSTRHVSLSRTVVLRKHQIDGFVARLKHHVRNTVPFQVEFNGLHQYCNEDRSKGFLGWVRCVALRCIALRVTILHSLVVPRIHTNVYVYVYIVLLQLTIHLCAKSFDIDREDERGLIPQYYKY